MMDEEYYQYPEPDPRTQKFHDTIREYVIFVLLFMYMYLVSYYIISKFRKQHSEEYLSLNNMENMTVYRISLWLCSFSLSVCLFATLLLPCSILSNEVLIHYPTSYYIKWLNHSLVQGFWNSVFLFSNLSLFIVLPFTYLFIESEGFSGVRRGVWNRVYESTAILVLLIFILLGFTYVVAAIIDKDNAGLHTIINLRSYYLPFLYSCISFLGVLMLLLCTPIGFDRLFTVVSDILVKPQFLHDLNQEFRIVKLEEMACRRRLQLASVCGKSYVSPTPMYHYPTEELPVHLTNGALQNNLSDTLASLSRRSEVLDKKRKKWLILRNLVYPLAILLLIVLTVITILLVVQNMVELLIGIKALPVGTMQFTIGLTSLSKLGFIGAFIEVVIILFVAVTSTVGLYSLPLVGRLCPRPMRTPLHHIIANCALLLLLSSALPLLSRTVGITNFDLLGEYGQIDWLGNFKIVLTYNIVFAVATALCISNKCSRTLTSKLIRRFRNMFFCWFPSMRDQEDSPRTSCSSATSPKQD